MYVRTCKPRGKTKGDDSSSQKKIFAPADDARFPQDRICKKLIYGTRCQLLVMRKVRKPPDEDSVTPVQSYF